MNAQLSSSSVMRRARAALLCVFALAGCGGGDFAELFVKLISARFVPASVSVARGASVDVELEVSCDRAGLDTPFGRLGVQIKLDPQRQLPAGVTATLTNVIIDPNGFGLVPCTGATGNPDLRIAHMHLHITVGPELPFASITLVALVQVEPLVQGEPSKDSTLAQITLNVAGGATPN